MYCKVMCHIQKCVHTEWGIHGSVSIESASNAIMKSVTDLTLLEPKQGLVQTQIGA